MTILHDFSSVLDSDLPRAFEGFRKVLDPEWIYEAFDATKTVTIRRRKLPPIQALWLVIAMALFRDRSIEAVVAHLGLVWGSSAKKPQTMSSGGVAKARAGLGVAPVEHLFRSTAEVWAANTEKDYAWRGLSIFGVDGTTLRVPDTESLRAAFGLPGHSPARGQTGYPQVRLLLLLGLRARMLKSALLGPCRGKASSEQTMGAKMWNELPENSLVIIDKGFFAHAHFFEIAQSSTAHRHWLIRAKAKIKYEIKEILGPGDALISFVVSSKARKENPELPKIMKARALSYQFRGGKEQMMLTSLLDSKQYPAKEIVSLYHERWDIEIANDEIKTDMLERKEALRSQSKSGIEQEIYGLLLAYNLVRWQIYEVAQAQKIPPNRVSFRHCFQLIRVFCQAEAWNISPAKLPAQMTKIQELIGLLLLPERRSERRYPRSVKIKMSRYQRNTGRPQTSKSTEEKAVK